MPNPEKAQRHNRQPHYSAWTLEFLSLVLSVASLLAAALVLARYNGKPLAEWGFVTSINTIISVLGVICKATVAFAVSSAFGQHKWNWFRARHDEMRVFVKFEEASRGPWGSMNLLLWSRARNWATVGALAIVITLLVDPFLQATVSFGEEYDVPPYRYDPLQESDRTWLPVAHRVDFGQALTDTTGPTAINGDGLPLLSETIVPDFGIISALYNGFHRTSVGAYTADVTAVNTQAVQFACETGNCTWPIFTTAAVCSRCNNVLQSRIIKTTGVTDSFQEGSDQYHPTRVSKPGQFPYTGYNVSYGHIRQFNGEFGQYYTEVLLTAFVNTNYSESVTFQGDNTTFATFLIMRASEGFLKEHVPWEDSWPTAMECGLSFCAKGYLSSATNGLLSETEL
ncbi:hypothetical protein B0T25DRAFT_461784, partial [Lasiosphaeria hispida]